MSRSLMQRLVLPSAIVVAIATAAGCSGGHHNNNNPAEGNSTAPMPAAPAPTTSSGSPLYNPAGTATTASTVAPGATAMAPAAGSTSAMANGPDSFAAQADQAGMLEIKLADLALQKSHNSQVKSFARKMKHDHTQANEKLKNVVGSNKQLPADLNAGQQQQVSTLESKSGSEFDKAYADQAVQDHQKAVSLFENASTNAPTEQLKNYASQTLPTLKEHLKLAQQLQSKVGG